jgi:uncharacterized protein DUF4328
LQPPPLSETASGGVAQPAGGWSYLSPDGRWRWDGQRWVPTSPPAGPRSAGVYEDASPRANFAVMGLAVAAVVQFICMVADGKRLSVVGRLLDGSGATPSEAVASDSFERLAAWLSLGSLVLGAAALLIWLHRIVVNNHAMQRRRLRFTAGWAVGWWFVPVMCLARPVQAVNESWKAADPSLPADPWQPPAGPTPLLIGAWWMLWLLGNLVLTVGSGLDSDTLQSLHDGTAVTLVGHLFLLAAAGLAMAVVWSLTQRQATLHARTQA